MSQGSGATGLEGFVNDLLANLDGEFNLLIIVAESDSSQLLAKSTSTAGGIQKVEQTAPLRDGPAAWAWDF